MRMCVANEVRLANFPFLGKFRTLISLVITVAFVAVVVKGS